MTISTRKKAIAIADQYFRAAAQEVLPPHVYDAIVQKAAVLFGEHLMHQMDKALASPPERQTK